MSAMARVLSVVAVLSVLCVADALKLPQYIKACRKDDPKLSECALKNGREAVSQFVAGDRKYKIPVLTPLTLYNFNVDSGNRAVGIKLIMKEAKIHGLGGVDIKNMQVDIAKKHFVIEMLFPTLNILGDYDISGRVLVLPITGQGPANITVTHVEVTFSFDYELVHKKKNGREHINLTTSNVTFALGMAYFDLQNLFNGNKQLGDNMNVFLNENWKDVSTELAPSIADTLREVIRQIIQQIVDVVPYDNIFL